MMQFYHQNIKPMRWYWILILIGGIALFTMNSNGYRLFSNNSKTWSQGGPGSHK